MKLLGIALRKPRYVEFTAASVMAVGLWVAAMGVSSVAGQALSLAEAAAVLVMMWWSCVGIRCGIDLARGGWRHWTAHGAIALALVALSQLPWALLPA